MSNLLAYFIGSVLGSAAAFPIGWWLVGWDTAATIFAVCVPLGVAGGYFVGWLNDRSSA